MAYTRMEKNIFSLVNFGSSQTGRMKLLRSGLDMTPFTTLLTCDVSHQGTWIETFSKWPSGIAINQSLLYSAGNLVLTTELKT